MSRHLKKLSCQFTKQYTGYAKKSIPVADAITISGLLNPKEEKIIRPSTEIELL